jgi:DNA-binding FadR family transcriptional regulator
MVTGRPDLMERRPPAERDRLHVPVVDAIEAQVLSGELRIGDRLPAEAELARAFNVSTRSVREALQILETKGLVRRKRGERANVVRDDIASYLGSLAVTVKRLFAQDSRYLVQLMDVRRIIEIEVVGRLSSGEGSPNSEVEQALAGMRAAADAGVFARFTDNDAAFHQGLVHSVGNEILSLVYDNLFGIIVEVIRVSSRVPRKSLDEAYDEHAEIYRLIRAGDVEGAKAAMRRQIDGSTQYLRVVLDQAAADGREA